MNIVKLIIYQQDGSVSSVKQVQDSVVQENISGLSGGRAALQVVSELPDTDPDKIYVDLTTNTVENRLPNMPLTISKSTVNADNIDEIVISNIPANTVVTWPDGQKDTIVDGQVEFSVDLEGLYLFAFDVVPYLRKEVIIEAVSAA